MRHLRLLILIMIIAIAAPSAYGFVDNMAITNAVMSGPQEVTVTVEANFCVTCSDGGREVDVAVTVGATGSGNAPCTWALGVLGSTDVAVPLTAPPTDDLTIDATFYCPWCGYWYADTYILELTDVDIDIKLGSCPNPFNPKSKGSVPVAFIGTEDLNVADIDPTTLELNGVPALPEFELIDSYGDPVIELGDYDPTDCYDCFDTDVDVEEPIGEPDLWVRGVCDIDGDGDIDDDDYGYCGSPDGYMDLFVKFDTQALKDAIAAAGGAGKGDCVTLTLTGATMDGAPIIGSDSMVVLKAIAAAP